jgi:rubredoxin
MSQASRAARRHPRPAAGTPTAVAPLPRHPAQRRIEAALFLTLFVAYAYFNQGGGWNQNARFDQVRAIVETGRLFINGYISYQAILGADGQAEVVRRPLPDHLLAARPYRLNTGDYAFNPAQGRYYPNKPPGTSFLAVPAYWATYRTERFWQIDPDALWPLTVNAFVTTALSVGLLGALGGVIFLRLSQCLFPDCPMPAHVASALTLGLATMMLPFSTLLFDHVPVAVLLMVAFYVMVRGRADSGPPAAGPWRPLLAGLAAGAAVLCSYAAAPGVVVLTAYAARVCRPRTRVLLFLAGGAALAVILAWYHDVCFGSPFTNANRFQDRLFSDQTGGLLFGMISLPDPDVAGKLLVGTRRGLLFTSPVLALSVVGLWWMAVRRRLRAEAALCTAMFVAYWVFNASFNGWHGGGVFAPRYLIPMVPFLVLPLTLVYARLWWIAAVPALFSAAIMLLATIVTPLPPESRHNPVWDFLVPLALDRPHARGPGFGLFEGPVSSSPIGVPFVRLPDEQWNSFNLGELLWPRRWLSVAPLVLCLAGGVAALFLLSRTRSRDDRMTRLLAEGE